MRRAFLAAALAAASGVLAGGQALPQQPPPTFRTSVEAVQLSVIVTDATGRPVSGLTADDFEIVENRASTPITTFAAVDIPIEQVERQVANADVASNEGPPGRLYVIAFDTISPTSAVRIRHFLRQFIENYFGPNDTAAVMLMTRGLRDSGQEFTSNPQLLLQAIDRFNGGDSDGNRERNFIGDLRNLMRFMATLRGTRKAVILVTESVPVDSLAIVQARPSQLSGLFSDFDSDLIEALSLATRNDIAIYPVDPRGLTTGVTGENDVENTQLTLAQQGGMSDLASVTGGFAFSGSNNYSRAFEQLVRENSTYYLIGFNSTVPQRDGRFVPIEVRVTRPGLQVRSVEGYLTPRGRPQEQRRPTTVLAATWDAITSGIATAGVPVRVAAAPFKRRGKDATVAISVEVPGSRLNLVEQGGAYRGVLEVVFAVTDVKNKRWPIWRHRAELALKPETYERVKAGAIRVLSQMPLTEGRYQLRASAGGVGLAGSVVYDLRIPDFAKDFSLSGITLTSRLSRDTFTFSPHKQIDVGLPGPPTTVREFTREDTLTLYTEAYENRRKPHTVTLTVQLRDEIGRVLDSRALERKGADKPNEASAYAFAPNLSLDQVSPGRYSFHVEARSSLDKQNSVTRDIPFTVR